MDLLTQIFGSKHDLTVAQECARTVVIFVYGLAAVRITGRRVFGKWAALDIVVSIMVGSNLSRALTGSAPFAGTLAATAVLMVLHWLLAHAAARWRAVSRLVEGAPIELVRQGRHDARISTRQAVSMADLEEAMRQKGLERIEDVHRIVLEPSGKLNVLKAEGGG